MIIVLAFLLLVPALVVQPPAPSTPAALQEQLVAAGAHEAQSPAPSTPADSVEQPERTYVHGTVFDAATRTPLSGASVVLTARNRIVATDQEGHFRLESSGVMFPVEVRITFLGYEEKNVSVTPRDTVRGLSIYLEPRTVEKGPIAVVSHRLQRGVSDGESLQSRTFKSMAREYFFILPRVSKNATIFKAIVCREKTGFTTLDRKIRTMRFFSI